MPEQELKQKKVYYKLSPELGDGVNFQVVDDEGLFTALDIWMNECRHGNYIGETCKIECVEMTQEGFNDLPDF